MGTWKRAHLPLQRSATAGMRLRFPECQMALQFSQKVLIDYFLIETDREKETSIYAHHIDGIPSEARRQKRNREQARAQSQ